MGGIDGDLQSDFRDLMGDLVEGLMKNFMGGLMGFNEGLILDFVRGDLMRDLLDL